MRCINSIELSRLTGMNLDKIKNLLRSHNAPDFWVELTALTHQVTEFDELLILSSLRKKAVARGLERLDAAGKPLRLAIVGGYSLYPLLPSICLLLQARCLAVNNL